MLGELGLSPYEVKIYTAMNHRGILSAKEISELSGVPPTAVYPNLVDLEHKGLIQKYSGSTATYSMINPKLALKKYAEKRAEQIAYAALESIKEFKQQPKEVPGEASPLTLTKGKDASVELTDRRVTKAKKTIYIMGWGFRKSKNVRRMLKILKDAAMRGVDVRVLINNYDNEFTRVQVNYTHNNFKMRLFPTDGFSIISIDNKWCKISLKDTEFHDRINVSIRQDNLASAMADYFLQCWKSSQGLTTFK